MSNVQRETYDDAERVTSCGLPRDNRNHREKRLELINAIDAGADASALEVGCGHGIHAEWYDWFFDEITALDLSPSLVAETATRLDSGDALQGDATALPFEDDSVDVVLGTAILHHLPDAAAALREWARVARSEVAVIEPNYWFPLAFATAHVLPEERHKRQMAPPHVRRLAASITDTYTVAPKLYTPPWPAPFTPWYGLLDDVLERVPGLRWGGQMLLIHLRL